MTLLQHVAVLIAGILCAYANGKELYEPSVAFVCDRGAMHMDRGDGWVSDHSTDCMEGKDEILAYCKKMYPSLEITNIVESSEYKHIKGWCGIGKTCNTMEAFKVRPYRCLTGPFQSDPLIVPEKCVFDHVHQPEQCHGFQWWSEVAHKACRGLEHMKTKSFAMLLPCGTDVFTGVEYVCCPDANSTVSSTTTEAPSKLKLPSLNVKVSASAVLSNNADQKDSMDIIEKEELKVVDSYMHMSSKDFKKSEHTSFTKAKQNLLKLNHGKVSKLMKEWAEARKRVMEMKEVDVKGAEKLNKEITPRFQNEYFALQSTSDKKVTQLDAVHLQHVQTNFDVKKRKAVEKLMEEIQKPKPQSDVVVKFLKRYINIEEKDAHHCINHYIKVKGRDTSLGQQMLPVTLEHLTLISTRINQSINLLATIKDEDQRNKVTHLVQLWRSKTFNNIDSTIAKFRGQLALIPITKASPTGASKTVEEKMTPKPNEKEMKKPVIYMSETKASEKTDDGKTFKQYADTFAKTVLTKEKTSKVQVGKAEVITDKEENQKEHEHQYKTLSKVQMNGMARSDLNVEMNAAANSADIPSQVSSSLSAGSGLAIAVGLLVGVVIVVLSLFLVKKKSLSADKKRNRQTYLEVAYDDTSAEDRHIAAMQNGYENPTYKLLECRM